jgi:hypothetical protein
MFVLNEDDAPASDVLAPPGPDATTGELMRYNAARLVNKYLGNEQQRPQNLKLAYNVGCFLAAAMLIQQFGDKFAV